jgi:hypothetical protein
MPVARLPRPWLPAAFGLVFWACGGDSTGPDQAAALTEADVTGTWRATVPAPGFIAQVVMDIRADHTLAFSQRLTGILPSAPDSTVDWAYETGTWSLQGNSLGYLKAACRYSPKPGEALKDSTCNAPLSKSYTPTFKDGKMSVAEGTSVYTFTKD